MLLTARQAQSRHTVMYSTLLPKQSVDQLQTGCRPLRAHTVETSRYQATPRACATKSGCTRNINLTAMMRARLTQMAKLVMAYMLDEACWRNLKDLMRPSRFSLVQHTEIMADSATKTSWCSRPLKETVAGKIVPYRSRFFGDGQRRENS